MKKTEVLRRQVLFLTCIFVALNAYLADSYLGVRVSATETLSRLPASLAFGAAKEVALPPANVVTKLEINCDELIAPYQKAIATKWLQLQLTNCTFPGKFQIKNNTNGVEASLFKTDTYYFSDLISLTKGENKIVISTQGKVESDSKELLITLQ